MNILITNDDGVHAEGLIALKSVLREVGRVFVVAPDRPRSACGHSITLHKPLRADKVKLADGDTGYASSGTPSDCVSLALLGLIKAPVDLVVSGINHGPNLGWDLTYSGTVSAAMEAVVAGVPSFAISVASYARDIDYSTAAALAGQLAGLIHSRKLPDGTLLNVNVPALPAGDICGIKVTAQGRRRYAANLDQRSDPGGRPYYWFAGNEPIDHLDDGTDVKAIADGFVSITPVHLDLTDHSALDSVKAWGVEGLSLKTGP